MLVLFMVPVYGAIVTAFKSQAEVSAGGYWTVPTRFAAENFERVMDPESGNLGLYLQNSLLLTIPASLFSIGLGTLAGYGLGKYSFKGDGLLFILIVAGMFLPPQIALIPVFRLMNDIGLYDTLWARHHHPHGLRHPDLHAGDAQLFPGGAQCPARGGAD